MELMPFLKVLSSETIDHRKTTNYELSTHNCKVKLGFTLLETLVVVTLLAIVGGASMTFFTSILKGSNQATITAEVKQNGQVVLDSLEKQIRNAAKAEKLTDKSGIKLVMSDNKTLYVACFPPGSTNGYIAVSNDGSNYTSITNQDLISGVDVKPCDIKCDCDPKSTKPAVVTVDFTLSQGVGAPSRRDFAANVQFKTVISLRSY